MSTLTHPLQHISGKDRDKRLKRSWRHCQHWKQSNHQSPLCWWHRRLSRRGRRTGKISGASWQSLHRLRHGDQYREVQADDKQRQGINTEININGQKLETVTSFKYLGSEITDEGSKPEILSTVAQTTAALTRLKPVWNDRSISLSSKIQMVHSLVISIFLCACESWILTAELQRRIQALEMRCYCKILRISYKDHVTNGQVRAKVQQATGPHEDLTIVKRRKLQWYGHVSHSLGLAITILQGIVKEERRQRRQRKRWEDNIREWTGLEFAKSQRAVENRKKWRKLVAKSSVVP